MMTGNSMKMADALVSGKIADAAFFLTVIASFILGVGTFRRAGCFLFSDYLYWSDAARFLPGALLSFAWGIVNSVGSEVTGTLIFVVTGAMVSFLAPLRFERLNPERAS